MSSVYVIVDGDSISVGSGASTNYSNVAYPWFSTGSTTKNNIAVSGQTFATILSNAPSNVDPLITTAHGAGQLAVVSCFAGTNDIGENGTDGPDLLTIATNYFQGRKTAGADICIGWTVLPRAGPNLFGDIAVRLNAYNALLRANYASIGIDYLLDVAACPSLATNNADGTTYNTDGLHPTTLGQNILAPFWGWAAVAHGSSVALTSALPGFGQLSGGTGISIVGSGLTGINAVAFAGIQAVSKTVNSSTSISASTGQAYANGAGDVVVIGPNGSARLAAGFSYGSINGGLPNGIAIGGGAVLGTVPTASSSWIR